MYDANCYSEMIMLVHVFLQAYVPSVQLNVRTIEVHIRNIPSMCVCVCVCVCVPVTYVLEKFAMSFGFFFRNTGYKQLGLGLVSLVLLLQATQPTQWAPRKGGLLQVRHHINVC